MEKKEKIKEEREYIELLHKRDIEKHKMKMEEFRFLRETDLIRHEQELTRQRIKSAEIRKAHEMKQRGRYN